MYLVQARKKDLESGQANAQICSLDDHYPIQLLDDLYHITVSLEKVVRLLPDQPDRFRRPCSVSTWLNIKTLSTVYINVQNVNIIAHCNCYVHSFRAKPHSS